jgi:hypothetical protein
VKKVAKDLGGSGRIGLYRVENALLNNTEYKDFIELQLTSSDMLGLNDTAAILKAAAYRLYIRLKERDKQQYEAIRVVLGNNSCDTFFVMPYLNNIYQSELIARSYLGAIMTDDTSFIRKQFNKNKFHYAIEDVDSINDGLRNVIKDSYKKSKLYNWETIIGKDSTKYKLLVFLTDTSNIYNVKFEFDLYDSLRTDQNIVDIQY